MANNHSSRAGATPAMREAEMAFERWNEQSRLHLGLGSHDLAIGRALAFLSAGLGSDDLDVFNGPLSARWRQARERLAHAKSTFAEAPKDPWEGIPYPRRSGTVGAIFRQSAPDFSRRYAWMSHSAMGACARQVFDHPLGAALWITRRGAANDQGHADFLITPEEHVVLGRHGAAWARAVLSGVDKALLGVSINPPSAERQGPRL